MIFEQIYKDDIFANEAGIEIVEITDDKAVMSLSIERRHLNGGSVAHGGAIYTLADIAMAAIANHKQPLSVSIQSDIRFLAAAVEGDTLRAEASVVFLRNRMSHCRAEISNQHGELIAIAEGMCLIKKQQ